VPLERLDGVVHRELRRNGVVPFRNCALRNRHSYLLSKVLGSRFLGSRFSVLLPAFPLTVTDSSPFHNPVGPARACVATVGLPRSWAVHLLRSTEGDEAVVGACIKEAEALRIAAAATCPRRGGP